jgi:hypothetical protein
MTVNKEILTDAKVVIDSFDLGNCANSVTIEGDAEMVETTGFGDGSRTYLKSFRNWKVTINFFDDFADNGLNEKLDGWWRTTSPIAIAITKADTTVAATNPSWTGNAWVVSVPLLTGQFGAASGGSLSLQGDGELTRNVAP